MALLGNYSVILKNPATFIGGTQVSNARSAFGASGQNLQMYYPDYQESTLYPIGLSDTFNDNSINSDYWFTDNASRVLETNGNIEITTNLAISYAGLYSLRRYSLIGSYASVKLEDAGNQALTSLEVYAIYLETDSNSANAILISGDTIYARRKTGGSWSTIGSSLAYVGATHQYFRIREYGGTVYYEYSTTGNPLEYTTIASTAVTFQLSSVLVGFFAGTYAAEASTTTVIFDDFCTHTKNPIGKWSIPSGTAPPYSWHIAEEAGGLSSSTFLSSDPFANGNMGVNIDSQINVTVTAAAVLQLVASLNGDGTVTVTAAGDGFGAATSPATASVSVVGTLDIVGIGGLLAQATVTADPTADIQATGELHSLVYLNQSEATVAQIADAVVQAIVDMGATGGLTVAEHAQLMKTLTVGKFIALK